jgi:uncharacterized protein
MKSSLLKATLSVSLFTLAIGAISQSNKKTMQNTDTAPVVQAIQGMFIAADKRDWPACRNYFTEKPFIDYSSLSGIPGSPVPADDLIKAWQGGLSRFKATHHMLSNMNITITGNTASAFFYGHAMHYLPHSKGGHTWEVYATYNAELVKESNEWKFSVLTLNLKLQAGNKDLPAIAANLPLEEKINFQSEGATLTGKLLLPASYKKGEKLPAIMIFGAWTQVKEQTQYVYGRKLAEQGYAVLNFDFRYWGESGGKPRYFESTNEKVKDVLNAIAYLKTHPAIDASNISLIGICAAAGVTLRASAVSKDVRNTATVAAWLQHPSTTPLFYGGEAGVKERIRLSEAAQKKFEDTGVIDYVEAYNPANPAAAMFFPLDYYSNTDRGRIPEWNNQFAVMGWKEWMTMNSIDGIAEKITCPIIMVHSDNSSLPDNAKRFYSLSPSKKKKLAWVEGEHTQFYDKDEQVDVAIEEILKFFKS